MSQLHPELPNIVQHLQHSIRFLIRSAPHVGTSHPTQVSHVRNVDIACVYLYLSPDEDFAWNQCSLKVLVRLSSSCELFMVACMRCCLCSHSLNSMFYLLLIAHSIPVISHPVTRTLLQLQKVSVWTNGVTILFACIGALVFSWWTRWQLSTYLHKGRECWHPQLLVSSIKEFTQVHHQKLRAPLWVKKAHFPSTTEWMQRWGKRKREKKSPRWCMLNKFNHLKGSGQ